MMRARGVFGATDHGVSDAGRAVRFLAFFDPVQAYRGCRANRAALRVLAARLIAGDSAINVTAVFDSLGVV